MGGIRCADVNVGRPDGVVSEDLKTLFLRIWLIWLAAYPNLLASARAGPSSVGRMNPPLPPAAASH